MDKDTALDLALEALEYIHEGANNQGPHTGISWRCVAVKAEPAITAIKQALAAPVQEPVAWKWQQAPVKTSWGHDMVVADLAIDKDNTVSVYCERDQTAKVEAMFTPPAAPVQEPVTWRNAAIRVGEDLCSVGPFGYYDMTAEQWLDWALSVVTVHAPPRPPAQRQWVGLTDEAIWSEYQTLWPFHPAEEPRLAKDIAKFARAIEAKLKEKNT